MPVAHQDVFPAVIIEIPEEQPECHQMVCGLEDARLFCPFSIWRLMSEIIERQPLGIEIADHQAGNGSISIISGIDAHSASRRARIVQRNSSRLGDFGKLAVSLIPI